MSGNLILSARRDAQGIRADFRSKLCSGRASSNGSKDVEFERRKNASARHIAADYLVEMIGQLGCVLVIGYSLRRFFAGAGMAQQPRYGVAAPATLKRITSTERAAEHSLAMDQGPQRASRPVPRRCSRLSGRTNSMVQPANGRMILRRRVAIRTCLKTTQAFAAADERKRRRSWFRPWCEAVRSPWTGDATS